MRTPQYELARAHSAEAQVTFREELSTRLPLSAAEREQFLGILAEHDAARLQFMDFIRSTRGLSREERQERLKNNDGISKQASEKSKPAWLSARISSVLGPARLAQYQEAISTRDTWRHN